MKYLIDENLWIVNGNKKNALFARALQILNSFDCSCKNETKNIVVIDINEDSIIVILNGAKMKYEKISKSDVYPIIYSVLYELAIREKMVFVHSVVVFKKQRCFLLLGDFNSGKTTLGLAFEKNGWKICLPGQSASAEKADPRVGVL